jgi:hypothetical protein
VISATEGAAGLFAETVDYFFGGAPAEGDALGFVVLEIDPARCNLSAIVQVGSQAQGLGDH